MVQVLLQIMGSDEKEKYIYVTKIPIVYVLVQQLNTSCPVQPILATIELTIPLMATTTTRFRALVDWYHHLGIAQYLQ